MRAGSPIRPRIGDNVTRHVALAECTGRDDAGVAEWQTQRTQNPPTSPCKVGNSR